ncbi:hyaluronan mediated motility receptor isoform X1 [Electrophorus electricus]|uniref:hyaluronan mediated motility receptor isoform X1 n=1 Tax=Electrophorus electricus TaxID=8005 RepID=UPI0015CFFACF|nr:hyaluronan mediated motility receptor isoform X1 [Electrophorus electricus]
MSFPRAPLKRFNEHVGCAPPPGTYEVKPGDVKGAVSFHKAERFKSKKSTLPPPPSPSKDTWMSPVRRTLSVDGLSVGSSSRKDKSCGSVGAMHQKLLEKEIRLLVQQRGEQDRRLLAMEEEVKRLGSKLLAAVREKTGLAASTATLERQLSELKKTNEFLKSKVSTDTTKKKIGSLSMELMEARNKLDAKDKELSFLQINLEGKVKVLETDLEASKANLGALQERNKDIENLRKETKAQNEELEEEVDKLHVVIQELREEIKALQNYLDAANEELQDLKGKLHDETATERRVSESQEKLCEVEQNLERCTAELHACRSSLTEKEEELQRRQEDLAECRGVLGEREEELEVCRREAEVSRAALAKLEEAERQGAQELQEARATARLQEQELARVREVLRRTEEELDQRVAHMGERCLALESEKSRTQEEGLRRVQELLDNISSLEESRMTEREAHKQLKERHATLAEQLEEEKSRIETLTRAMAGMRDHMEAERKQLEGELEEVLDEVSRLEEQERLHQEAIQHLREENTTLEEIVKSDRTELERRDAEMKSMEGAHAEATRKIQEEHGSSLGKIGELAIELESGRRALSELKEQTEAQRQQLQEEVGRLGRQLLEEREKLRLQQQTQDKEREEYARMLLEAQTKLAQSEEEARRTAEAHGLERSRLQGEVEQEREELQRGLEQLQQARQKRQSAEGGAREWLLQEVERERRGFSLRPAEAEQSASNADTKHWRRLYEELFAKVKPFQEQLDGFAAERDALLSEKGSTQAELSKLADAYANLLGHQNQRQKIKHMVKLKEDNLGLKQEVSKLRAQVGKQQRELEQLRSSHGPRKFDPSKAFKHELKENHQPDKHRLKEPPANRSSPIGRV